MHDARAELAPPGRAPGPLLQLLELRAPLEAGVAIALRPCWSVAPRGDGHPVLVLPGLTTGDGSTAVLRHFLRARGHAVRGWGQGLNLGLREGVLDKTRDTLRRMADRHGRRVSLVGWSLGGIYARELAKEMPELVRVVVTLASPFSGHPRETNAWRLYELASGHRIGAPDLHSPLRTAPPVPTTSIWSRTDGVVAWRCCVQAPHHETENIEVEASHCGIGAHPAALYALADRLAQPEGEWAPFHREGWRALVYADTLHVPEELTHRA